MKRKVIAFKYLPSRLPITFSILVWLLLDRFKPTDLWTGATYCFLVVLWIICIFGVFSQEAAAPADIREVA